jgi:geranylgeranylglycerol-phosphate geranylgeranyltransferase
MLAWVAGVAVLAATLGYALRHRAEMPRLEAYVELVRPFTLIAPVIAGACFGLMGEKSAGWVHWNGDPTQFIVTMIWGVGALVLVNAASNSLNAVYDLDIDRINKPERPLPRGAINPQEATTIAYLLYLLTLFRASFLNPAFFVFVTAIVLLTIAYSAPPLRTKKHFILNNATIALARGLFGVLASWSIFGDPFSPVAWSVGLVFFVFLLGAATTKDFNDIPGDKEYGMRTLPIVVGVERSAIITASFFVLPIVFIPVLVQLRLLYDAANILVVLLFWGAFVLVHTKEWSHSRDRNFENNPMWAQMYFMLMALAVGFSATYILS